MNEWINEYMNEWMNKWMTYLASIFLGTEWRSPPASPGE